MAYNYGYAPAPAAAEITAALGHLSAEELNAILIARRIEHLVQPSQNPNLMAATVAAQLSYAVSISQALRELSLRELTVLRVLWRTGLSIAARSIAPAFASVLDKAAVDKCLKRLQELALFLPVNAERSAYFVPSSVRAVLLGRNGPPHPAHDVFQALNGDVSKAVANAMGISTQRNRHADRVEAISQQLTTPDAVRARVEALPKEARQVFDYVVSLGGTVEPWNLVQKFPQARKQAPNNYTYSYGGFFITGREPAGGPHDAITLLQLQGLLTRYPPDWSSVFVVVDEVLTALLPPLKVDAADFIEPVFAPPPAEARPAGGHTAPVLDLIECLQFINDERPALTQKGLFPKPQVKKLAKQLSAQDTVYGDLLIALALSGDLTRREGSQIIVRTKKTSAWLAAPEFEQRVAMYDGWLGLQLWQDDRDEPYPRTNDPRGSLAAVRAIVAGVLAELPDEGATIASCAGRVRYRMPGWFAAEALGVPVAQTPRNDSEAFVRGVLRDLALLAYVEPLQLPATRQGGVPEVVALRLTPLGRAVLRHEEPGDDAVVPRTDRIIVQPTLDVLAPPNVDPTVYSALRRFTDPAGAKGMRTLTLTPASLRRAFDSGMKPQAAKKLLEERSNIPLPSTVERLFADVSEKYGRIHVGQAGFYLTVDEPHLLAELKVDKRLPSLVVRQIAPTVAIVRGDSLAQILTLLRSIGHMPVADDRIATPNAPASDEPDPLAVLSMPAAPSRAPALPRAPAIFPGLPDLSALPPQISSALLQRLAGDNALLELLVDDSLDEDVAGVPIGERVSDPLGVVNLLEQAIEAADLVEMEYLAKRNGREERRTVLMEPFDLTLNTVYGTDQNTYQNRTYKLNRINWARIATEPLLE